MNNREARARRQALLRGTWATWGGVIRTDDGHVDVERQLAAVQSLGVTTYNFPVWNNPHDWDDCQRFLPLAAEAGLKVWITILSPWQGGNSQPFESDFLAWFDAFGRLAGDYANLVAVSIDDFACEGNLDTFTPHYVRQLLRALRQKRDDVAFCSTIYGLSPVLLEQYAKLMDGVTLWWVNLDTTLGMEEWLWANKTLVAGRFPIIAGVYAHPTTWHPAPPAVKAFRHALRIAHKDADGVMLFHPNLAAGDADPLVVHVRQTYRR